MSDFAECFTITFGGDVRKLGFNPMAAKTIFGEVQGVCVGNLMDQLDRVEELVEREWPEADDLIDGIRKIRAGK